MGGGGGSYSGSSDYTKPVSESNSTGGSSSNAGSGNDCRSISFQSQLQQPNLNALQKVEEGDVLLLSVPKSISRVEVLNNDGGVCGSVVSPVLSRLITCIENGSVFKAAVISLQGDKCTVLVRHEGQ